MTVALVIILGAPAAITALWAASHAILAALSSIGTSGKHHLVDGDLVIASGSHFWCEFVRATVDGRGVVLSAE